MAEIKKNSVNLKVQNSVSQLLRKNCHKFDREDTVVINFFFLSIKL